MRLQRMTEEQELALRRAEGWVIRRDAWGRVRLYDVVCGLPRACARYDGQTGQEDQRDALNLCEHFRFGHIRREIDIWPGRMCYDLSPKLRTGDVSAGSRQLAICILNERFDWPTTRELYERFTAHVVQYKRGDWSISRAELNVFWALYEDRKLGEVEYEVSFGDDGQFKARRRSA